MNKLEQKHINFLRSCAAKPNSIHALPKEVDFMDADAMAKEGLLVKYNKPTGPQYAIGRYGAQFVKEGFGVSISPEMTKLAVDYVTTKGYTKEAAEKVVIENGVELILQSQAEEMRRGTQREVVVPLNDQGKPEIKYKG